MSFATIYGHHRQISMLERSIAQQRVGHAYLFSGLEGIGKKTLALAFAQTLNCENPVEHKDACGQCPPCRKLLSGNHPDVHQVSTERQFLRIDDVRQIQNQMTFKPLDGRLRIVIIDDADKMNEQAANALLKTLEEPTSSNVLILISARPYWLPQTVLSRCRHLRFNPLPADLVARYLVDHLSMAMERARLLANLSGGSIAKALDLNTEEMTAYRGEFTARVAATTQADPMSLIALASFLGQDKNDIRHNLGMLNAIFRDALIYKETQNVQMVTNSDCLDLIASLAARLDGERMLQNIAQVTRSMETLEMNVNKSLTLEAMAFKLHL
ncbi:MAG: DNA polymerase III subunit delta' [Smithellaceae bacterium]